MTSSLSFDYLNEICDGDDMLKMEIIDEMLTYIPKDLERLLGLYKNREVGNFAALLHKVKTPILMIAEDGIKERITALERKVKVSDDLISMEDAILQCFSDVGEVVDALTAYKKQNNKDFPF